MGFGSDDGRMAPGGAEKDRDPARWRLSSLAVLYAFASGLALAVYGAADTRANDVVAFCRGLIGAD